MDGNHTQQNQHTLGASANFLIDEIDRLLCDIRKVLHRSQPPSSGKLEIVFVDEGGKRRQPIFAELHYNRHGERFIRRAKMKYIPERVKSRRGFSVNYSQTKSLVTLASSLMATRKKTMATLNKARLWESNLARRTLPRVLECADQIEELKAEVEDNLVQWRAKQLSSGPD